MTWDSCERMFCEGTFWECFMTGNFHQGDISCCTVYCTICMCEEKCGNILQGDILGMGDVLLRCDSSKEDIMYVGTFCLKNILCGKLL